MDTQRKTCLEVLHFSLLNKVNLCLDLTYVNKIIAFQALEPVPESPYYLAGLMNFAGQTIPVIDLALKLGLKRTEPYTLDTPIVLCKINSASIGLIIDHIYGLTNVAREKINFKENLLTSHSVFLASVIIKSRLALLLNIKNLFQIEDTSNNENSQHDQELINKVVMQS